MSIIKKTDEEEFSEFYIKNGATPVYSTLCEGAANSEMLTLLGLEKSDKMLMQSIVCEALVPQLCEGLTYELGIDLPDRGIAIAIPLSSIASRALLEKIEATARPDVTKSDVNTNTERKHSMELIVSICPKGSATEVMKVARNAGAAGGTVIKAKGTAREGLDTFFGMAISNEKEVIFIVSKKEQRNPIMQAVATYKCPEGVSPITFSLPVSDVAGLRLVKD